MFHLNLASLGKHKDELVTVLSLLSFEFDIIAISETKILKDIDPSYDIKLPGYRLYDTPTESSKGGVMIYYKECFTVSRRTDLEEKLYLSRALESVFIEIDNDGTKKNEIFGYVEESRIVRVGVVVGDAGVLREAAVLACVCPCPALGLVALRDGFRGGGGGGAA